MRVAIVGSRTYDKERERLVKSLIDNLGANGNGRNILLITGCASGVDKTVREYGPPRGFVVAALFAPWKYYGRPAGPMRNQWAIDLADEVYAFPSGDKSSSPGTWNVIDCARSLNKPVHVYGEVIGLSVNEAKRMLKEGIAIRKQIQMRYK